ncbi:MAG: hypothetical protein LUD46_04705 [Parabacteroides sp.]|nr:hypothetical protein [Parabacteroides sp.]
MYKKVEYHYQQDSGSGYKENDAEGLFPQSGHLPYFPVGLSNGSLFKFTDKLVYL